MITPTIFACSNIASKSSAFNFLEEMFSSLNNFPCSNIGGVSSVFDFQRGMHLTIFAYVDIDSEFTIANFSE